MTQSLDVKYSLVIIYNNAKQPKQNT